MKNRIFLFTGLFCLLFFSLLTFAQFKGSKQEKVLLEDVDIKGEVNQDNMSFARRSKLTMDDRITIRRNFRDRILENLPTYYAEDVAKAPKK